jgi:uncharacterized protein YcfJ
MTILNTKRSRNNLALSIIAAVVVSATSLPVVAGKHRGNSHYDNATVDYARVLSVDPVIERYQVNEPSEHCWDERVPSRNRSYSSNDYSRSKSNTPTVLGAIIGGVIGNQIGKHGGGRSRDVATVAGAVLGGSIGRDVKHNNRRHSGGYSDRHSGQHNDHYQNTRYETVQRCEIKDSYVTKEQVVGYDISYKYRGNIYYTQLNERPGDKIKVKVTVNPV